MCTAGSDESPRVAELNDWKIVVPLVESYTIKKPLCYESVSGKIL